MEDNEFYSNQSNKKLFEPNLNNNIDNPNLQDHNNANTNNKKRESNQDSSHSPQSKLAKNVLNDTHQELPKRTKRVLVQFSEKIILEAKVLVMESWGIMVGLLEGSIQDEEYKKGKKLFCKWKGEVKPILCTPILQPIYKNFL